MFCVITPVTTAIQKSICRLVIGIPITLLAIGGGHAAGLTAPPDADADGIPDSADNCLFVVNRAQRDTDMDGFGNLCDGDFDNDGQTTFADLGLLKQNFFGDADLYDLDGNGVANFSDLSIFKQMIFQPPGPSGKITACIGSACDNLVALCEEGTEDPPLVVSWDSLPDPDSLAVVPLGGFLPLTVTSDMPVTVFVQVEVAGALDELRRTIDLGTLPLAPFASITLQVDPNQFGGNIPALDYAGRLVARATVRLTPEGPVERMAYTSHGFLHVAENKIRFYGKRRMMEEFGSGDYKGIALAARTWAKDRGIKLVGVGHAGRLHIGEDDGGPREPQE